MNNSSAQPKKDRSENLIAGIVGAFLFSLAGAAVWVVLDLVGFMAGLSGLVAAVCAIQGYRIFGGKLSKKGVVISAVIALLMLVLAWYFCLSKDVYEAYKDWFAEGEVDYMPTFAECFRNAWRFLSEPDIAKDYMLSLGIGILLAVVGSFRYVVNAFRSTGSDAQPNGQPVSIPHPVEPGSSESSGFYVPDSGQSENPPPADRPEEKQ